MKKIIATTFMFFVVAICCLNAFGFGLVPDQAKEKQERLEKGYDEYLTGQLNLWYSQTIDFTKIQSIDKLISSYKAVYPKPVKIKENDPFTEYFIIYDLSSGQQALLSLANNPDNMPGESSYIQQQLKPIRDKIQIELNRLEILKETLKREGYLRELRQYFGVTRIEDARAISQKELLREQFNKGALISLLEMQVFQIRGDGVLIDSYMHTDWNGVAFLYTHKRFSINEGLDKSQAIYIGTYTYKTLLGEENTVPAFRLLCPEDYPNIDVAHTYFLSDTTFKNKLEIYGDSETVFEQSLVKDTLQKNGYQLRVPDNLKGIQK